MRHLDLFSGIGGFALAARWMGWETVAFCECEPYCQKVLKKHWPDVPIINDIREITDATITNADKREGGSRAESESIKASQFQLGANKSNYYTIDIITGGFPCQPFSNAGKRNGTTDNRFLWPEMLRVIRLFKPEWVVAENVPGILTIENGLVFERVCTDLEGEGYTVQAVVIPAVSKNAKHRRDRVWFVAESRQKRFTTTEENKQLERSRSGINNNRDGRAKRKPTNESRWLPEPAVGRVANGIPCRVDRLKALGNAIVPQVAYEIFKAIEEAEHEHCRTNTRS